MIYRRTSGGWFLRRQERAQLLPAGISQGRQARHEQSCWQLSGDRRRLKPAPLPVAALRARLMLTPKS
jgi:hypothetical protein